MDLSAYVDLFVAESREHLGSAYDLATALDDGAPSATAVRELFRHVHSVKGMAASMGYRAMSGLAHDVESLMDRLRRGGAAPTPHARKLLCATLACLERMVDAAERKQAVDDAERTRLQSELRGLLHETPIAAPPSPSADPGGSASPRTQPNGTAPDAPAGCLKLALILRRDRPYPAVRAAVVIGRLAAVGRIVATEPPMATLRAGRFDGRLLVTLVTERPLRAVGAAVAEIDEVASFTSMPAEAPPARQAPKGPTATLRVRADRIDAIFEVALDLMTHLGRLEAGLRGGAAPGTTSLEAGAARALARRVYEEIAEVRLVPFEVATQRLARGAAELARTLGKTIAFEVSGQEVRIDRSLLEALMDPLLHMLRNAVDHGLEPRDARLAAGKPPDGQVRIRLERRASRLWLCVEDDGRGLDPRALKSAAIERGLVTPGEAARLDDDEAFQLVTLPGFTTAAAETEVSGRGVGMDVVRSAVEAVGGRLRIHAAPGRGTRFELLLPAGVALVQACLVRDEDEVFAVPLTSIVRIEGSSERLALVYERPSGPQGRFLVDEVLGRREIVVRPLPGALAGLPGYSGCALIEDGTIALVLDLPGWAG
jgi:two-component system chemotaxis sensor kinase CheA